jgi:exonuclease SbcD
MKLLHTADWHLGHQLHGYSRLAEHQFFLDWLLAQIVSQEIDVLCVCGDLFDTANPSAASWRQLYQFLADIAQQSPGTQVVMVAGNHDSPSKINAPQALMAHFNLHFVGSVPQDENGLPELNRLLVPLKTRGGDVKGWALAVPFLRATDVRLDSDIEDSQLRWQQGISHLYQSLGELANSVRKKGQLLVALGHGHVNGGQISEMSERHVMIGGQHALPTSVFPDDCDYVALGHLHLAQQIKGPMPIHYSGSPLALSMSERRYNHQVKLVAWGAEGPTIESLAVPKLCQMLRIPDKPEPLESVLSVLKALPAQSDVAFEAQDYLEVLVALDKPKAQVREQILEALTGKGLRLAKITTHYPDADRRAGLRVEKQLDELNPTEVFELCYRQSYSQDPEPKFTQAFAKVLQQLEEDA